MVPGGVSEASGLDSGRGRRALSSAARASYSRVSGPDPESRDRGCGIVVEDVREIVQDTRAGAAGNVRVKWLYSERREARWTN
jgi:hypothetical protein